MNYKLSLIIPLCNLGEEDYQYRLDILNKVLPNIPTFVQVVIVEQIVNSELPTYVENLKGKMVYEYRILEHPIFNKAWCYNIATKYMVKSENLLFTESDIAYLDDYFEELVKQIKSKKSWKWAFGWNHITYYDLNGGIWMERKPTPHNSEGVLFIKKKFLKQIGYYGEFIKEIGGNDGELVRRAEFMTKNYPSFDLKIEHLYHPYNSLKKDGFKHSKSRQRNKDIYYRIVKNPRSTIEYFLGFKFGNLKGPCEEEFMMDNEPLPDYIKYATFKEIHNNAFNRKMNIAIDRPELLSLDYWKCSPTYKLFLESIKDKFPKKILDIGSCTGELTSLYSNYAPVTAIEISDKAIEYAKKTFPSAKVYFIEGEFKDINFRKLKYDLICMCDVLEHNENPKKMIEKATSLLSKDGKLIITVPKDKNYYDPSHRCLFYSYEDILTLFDKTQIKVLLTRQVNNFLQIIIKKI